MDGLNYDDIEKMLASQQWRARRAAERPQGRYLDVVRPGGEMKRQKPTAKPVAKKQVGQVTSVKPAPAKTSTAVVMTETTVAVIPDEELSAVTTGEEGGVKGGRDEVDDAADLLEKLIIEEEDTPTEQDVTETFLGDTPNPFLPDAIERVEKRPLSRDIRDGASTAPMIVGSRAAASGAKPIVGPKPMAKKPQAQPEKSRLRAIYAKDKVSDALTKEVSIKDGGDVMLEREVEIALSKKPAKKLNRQNAGNRNLLIFCVGLIIVFGAVALGLGYYLFIK
ncbi:hypothetical protein FWH13_01190 [Candidatus Saccharibacteria bacterium]|nr:hypothetical protein [Candidatus Saccharibacteria bacterium]